MLVIESSTIEHAYEQLLYHLKQQPATGNTKEVCNCCLIIHEPTLSNFCFPFRKISERYANAELEWYWSADNSCHKIGKHAKMWLNISDDGITSNSAYGYILHKKYNKDQLQEIIKLLTYDKTSRRAILNISDPTLDKQNTKDLQCTIAIQFLVRNGELQETVYMRSNDIYFGLPYDYIYFVSIGLYIAQQLNLKLGLYTHHATSMHMYLQDEAKLIAHTQNINIDVNDVVRRHYEKQDNYTHHT